MGKGRDEEGVKKILERVTRKDNREDTAQDRTNKESVVSRDLKGCLLAVFIGH